MPTDRPNKSHGTFTPASTIARVLTGAGYHRFQVSRGMGLGGHRCSWEKVQEVVEVRYWPGDDTPESRVDTERAEMLTQYAQILTGRGYHVEHVGSSLRVNPVKETS